MTGRPAGGAAARVQRRGAVAMAALFSMTLLLLPDAGLAWSGAGHEVVCEIAWQELDPKTRDFLREIRREAEEEPYHTFFESCTWPDEARRSTHVSTYEYHFVNVPPAASGLDLARDCPALDCLPVALRRYAIYLAVRPDGERQRQRRSEALRFVGHLMADLHQPLHLGRAEDRGGNDLEVSWFGRQTNLHQVWDSDILTRAGIVSVRAARRLHAEITPEQARAWSTGDLSSWADESFRLARNVAYRLPEDRRLDEEYYARAWPVARVRLQQAGVRLARLLEAASRGLPNVERFWQGWP